MTAKTRKFIIIISIVLAGLSVFAGASVALVKIGEAYLRDKLSFNNGDLNGETAYGDNAEVFYKGEGYVYNENLINILCIGVDKLEKADKRYKQADALYLLSLNTENNKLNIVAISRNTLADIDIYDINNEFLNTERAQVCLSYVYGKDDEQSSELTAKSVSRLLYNIPLNYYYTIFMDGVSQVVDSVGGVEVTLSEDMTSVHSGWKKGNRIVLKSDNVLSYLRYREESNEPRLQRQTDFIKSFFSSANKAFSKNISLPIDIYKRISENSETNIGIGQIAYLTTELSKSTFKIHTIKGKSGFDGMYETFEADDTALYEMVLNLFYIKTN